ncbi:sushi repeat-containing protein SRPX-like [Diadema setosum]|uniref:sushi repeat-containing protein SRPX-like n=1 Tax=Diadema setosum TaxID=31175 RepID=UPI003B3BAA0F
MTPKSIKTVLSTIGRFWVLVVFVLPLEFHSAGATSPKFTNCVGNIGKQYTISTCHFVSWVEPIAVDNDQFIPVSRVSGEGPGSTFPEGSHKIEYLATDDEGNYASCTIRFEVVMIRCPSLLAPYNGHVACSDINNVDSVCTYMCFTGLYLHNGSPSRTCQLTENKTTASWTGSAPACSDGASPRFKYCTGNIGNQYTTRTCEIVTWSVPTAVDEFISVSRVSGESPGSTFPEGSHEVQYRATDNEGNYANCTIRFKVVVIRCPSLWAPYDGHVACSDINNVGSNCTYMCFTGHQLHNGSSSRTCRRTNNTASWTGTAPACSDLVIGSSVSPTPAGTERSSPFTIVLISVIVVVVVVVVALIGIVLIIRKCRK